MDICVVFDVGQENPVEVCDQRQGSQEESAEYERFLGGC
jgi:hypothetical protein